MTLPLLVTAFNEGRFEEVAQSAAACVDGSAQDSLVLSMLGVAQMQLQRSVDAANTCREAATRFPDVAVHWNNLGTALRNAGQLQDADSAYARALQIEPRNAAYLANRGFLAMQCGEIVRAAQLLQQACSLDPSDFEARIHAAEMSIDCADDARAHALLDDWRDWAAQLTPELGVDLASQLIRLGSNADGESLLRRYVDDTTQGHVASARLALALERLNRVDEARDLVRSLPPADAVADAATRRELDDARAVVATRDNDLALARMLIERRVHAADGDRGRASALFTLARVCDKQRDYAACLGYLQQAHAEQVKSLRQQVPELFAPHAVTLGIARVYLALDQVQAWPADEGPDFGASPVFVVGFPRSGTTMLEQMLDAHPTLQSMDERTFLQDVLDRMLEMGLRYPEDLGALAPVQLDQLRALYWAKVATAVRLSPGQRLVDKNPLNMLRLPLIARLFPRAPIVFVVRHPCDVLLSCYMQQFRAPEFAALCATLESLAEGYAAAMRFWFHHAELLRPRCMEWRYEDAVRDFGASVARVAEFVGLDDAAPLRTFSDHARHKGYIGTPSYAQVVKPVYSDSVARWEHYRSTFAKVLPVVQPVLQRWGYRG